ncbi:MAG: hypothetical protein WC732_01870 [Candidatus Omnitrophota bacterium]
MAFDAGNVVGHLVLDTSGFSNRIAEQARERAQRLSEGFSDLGKNIAASSRKLGEVGRNLAFLGTGIVAPLVLAFKSAEKYSNSVRVEMERLNSITTQMRISVAESLVPVMHRFSNILAELFQRWNNLSQALRDSILQTALIAGAWTLIGGLALNLAAKVGLLVGRIMQLTGTLIAFSLAHPGIALTVAALAGVVYAITKIGGLTPVLNGLEKMALNIAAGWTKVAAAMWQTLDIFLRISDPFGLWSRKIQELTQLMQETLLVQLEGINARLQDIASGSNGVMAGFVDGIAQKINAVKGLFTGLGSTEFSIPNKIFEASKSFAEGWHDALQDAVHNLTNFGAMAGNIVTQTTSGMQSAFSNLFQGVLKGQLDSAKEFFAEFGNMALKIIGDVIAGIITSQILAAALNFFTGGIGGLFGKVAGMGSVPIAPPNYFLGHADGIDRVPSGGFYKLHPNEQVVPAYDAGKNEAMTIEIHNFITPEAVARAMSGREGKGVIVNVIDENSLRYGVIKREVVRR